MFYFNIFSPKNLLTKNEIENPQNTKIHLYKQKGEGKNKFCERLM